MSPPQKKAMTAKELEACAEALLDQVTSFGKESEITDEALPRLQIAVATAQAYATVALSRRVGEFRHFYGAVLDLQYKERKAAEEAKATT